MNVLEEGPAGEAGGHEGGIRLLSDRTYMLLKRAIVFGRLAPNAKLVERDICEQLAISRTPLREALLRLAADGLVVVKPQSGTLVAPITLSRVMAAQFIREKLECGLIKRVIDRWGRASQDVMLDNIAAQKQAAEREDFEAFHDLDETFHAEMSLIAGLPDVWAAIALSKPHLDRVRIASLDRRKHIHDLIADHADIVTMLAARDATRTKRILRVHLRQVIRSIEYFGDAIR